MHVGNARLKTRSSPVRAGYFVRPRAAVLPLRFEALQNAVAEGDTRTISMHHMHTGEDITITYKREGRYDEAALEKLNWFLRDWRRSEQTQMDPHLIDLVWEVQREAGAERADPGGVRLPLAGNQRHAAASQRPGVARFSQHMLGHAMDFYIPGVQLEKLRESACGCSAAASASIPNPARPSCTWIPAASACGRA